MVSRVEAEMLKGHLDGLILSVLEPAPLHGYAIIGELKRRSDGALTLPEGTIYPALHRLEGTGFLSSAWSNADGRRRRVYRLTGRGRRQLRARRSQWSQFAAMVESVLTPGTQVLSA